MILFLRFVFSGVLVAMLSVTAWASLRGALWDTPHAVVTHPWFIATLFDTYFAFLTFFCWVAYKETKMWARAVWLLAILTLGNIAMASYILIQLFRAPSNASLESVLLRRRTG
jgi:hypothetical protein